jgi:hypothetical protein
MAQRQSATLAQMMEQQGRDMPVYVVDCAGALSRLDFLE